MAESLFKKLCDQTLTKVKEEALIKDLESKNRLTYRQKEPEKATHTDLLIFEKHLGVGRYELYNTYLVAKDTLTPIQIEDLKKHITPAA